MVLGEYKVGEFGAFDHLIKHYLSFNRDCCLLFNQIHAFEFVLDLVQVYVDINCKKIQRNLAPLYGDSVNFS